MTLPDRRFATTATTALLFTLSIAAASCTAESNAADIAASEVAARIEAGAAPLLLDVRTPEEFASGHVPGALNIPHDELAQRLGRAADLPCDRADRFPLGPVLRPVLQHHANRSLAYLR